MILPDDVPRSLFRYNGGPGKILSELPEKLRRRVVKTLNILHKNKISGLTYSMKGNLLRTVALFHLHEDEAMSLTETIELLHWYLNKLSSGGYSMRAVCEDCNSELSHGAQLGGKCPYTMCPSHKKWAEVIDGYKIPKSLTEGALPVPPRTDAANSWAQKG
ncbi:MAG: hypothetical protein HZB10_01985 [Candidatus Yonathbacteria bacterium]|nr:hypothetical protein [Candidatus Yonathbacteria bacterium]